MTTFVIVETDNFGGDYPNESIVNIPRFRSREAAQELADLINKNFSSCADRRFWKVVEHGYILRPGFEP